MSLPPVLLARLASAPALGFSGSRSVVPPVLSPVVALAASASVPVLVGCAGGVDGYIRTAFVGMSDRLWLFEVEGEGRGAFAARSIRFVNSLWQSQGVLFSVPSSACPVGLVPSMRSDRCFCGAGSGSWASLAFAAALGISCFVFLDSLPAPAGWGLISLGDGWWWSYPAPSQLSLF